MIAASNDQEPAVTSPAMPPVPAIDIVAGIFDEEALSYRPGWQEGFFSGKMKAKANMKGVSLEQQLEQMASAGIERAFRMSKTPAVAVPYVSERNSACGFTAFCVTP